MLDIISWSPVEELSALVIMFGNGVRSEIDICQNPHRAPRGPLWEWAGGLKKGSFNFQLPRIDTHLTQSTKKVTPFSCKGRKLFEPLLKKCMYTWLLYTRDGNSCIVISVHISKRIEQGVPGKKYWKYCALLTCWSTRKTKWPACVYMIKSTTQAGVINVFISGFKCLSPLLVLYF